ncbi:transposable element Tc3 transposase [Trichonephila clavipes]|nr:transposable element Tc3 transposase [Trichonephila clavipes]
MIWAKCPKEIFVNKRRVKRAVTEAVCEYNKGTVRTIVETQKALGVATGGSTKQLVTILDCRKQKFRKRRQNANEQLEGFRDRCPFKYQELWLQQDGATCHTARDTIYLLKDTFGDCLISRFGPVNWRPRSWDLTPLDYFLWGYVKSLVYADKPQTLDHLEDNIRRVIADIRPQMLEKVIENWTSRLDYIRASRGRPMPEIIFKM